LGHGGRWVGLYWSLFLGHWVGRWAHGRREGGIGPSGARVMGWTGIGRWHWIARGPGRARARGSRLKRRGALRWRGRAGSLSSGRPRVVRWACITRPRRANRIYRTRWRALGRASGVRHAFSIAWPREAVPDKHGVTPKRRSGRRRTQGHLQRDRPTGRAWVAETGPSLVHGLRDGFGGVVVACSTESRMGSSRRYCRTDSS